MWSRGDNLSLVEKFLRFLFEVGGGLDEGVGYCEEDDLNELDADSLCLCQCNDLTTFRKSLTSS